MNQSINYFSTEEKKLEFKKINLNAFIHYSEKNGVYENLENYNPTKKGVNKKRVNSCWSYESTHGS